MRSNGLKILALVMLTTLLTACGGTKVMTANKTIVVNDSIYNVAQVRQFRFTNEAVLDDGSTRDLRGVDRRDFQDLVEVNGPVRVQMKMYFDEQEIVYRNSVVDSWGDYSRMNRSFENALEDVRDFLAHKKKTQLELD